jgi:thiol-disulfide isomerase/thioredoxin
VLAACEARRHVAPAIDAPPVARRTGWGVTGLAAAGLVAQVLWIVPYLDRMRPVAPGDPAPVFALPRIEAKGALGAPFSLASARGKVVIVDFWATWCQPCVKSLPRLEAIHRQHPDVAVVAINIDDPADARELFDEAHYTLTLLAGSKEVSDRYDVAAIPHTVVIDPLGIVQHVHRGGRYDLEREISALGVGSR